jgi:hypothetical protein
MLLCDMCDAGWHMDCLPVPLDRVPEGMQLTSFMPVPVCHSWKGGATPLTAPHLSKFIHRPSQLTQKVAQASGSVQSVRGRRGGLVGGREKPEFNCAMMEVL